MVVKKQRSIVESSLTSPPPPPHTRSHDIAMLSHPVARQHARLLIDHLPLLLLIYPHPLLFLAS